MACEFTVRLGVCYILAGHIVVNINKRFITSLHRFQYFGQRNRFGELLPVSEKDGPEFAKRTSARELL